MHFGWKRLIPISLFWIVAVATIRAITLDGGIDRQYLLGGIGVLAVLFLVLFFVGETRADDSDQETVAEQAPVDAFAGGFPVPPLPTGGAVRGAARPLVFETRSPAATTAPTTGEET
jgi:NADH-quinone oxidoreductase subunit H